MNNEYQDALNFIYGYALDGALNDDESNTVRKKVAILQELVDKGKLSNNYDKLNSVYKKLQKAFTIFGKTLKVDCIKSGRKKEYILYILIKRQYKCGTERCILAYLTKKEYELMNEVLQNEN